MSEVPNTDPLLLYTLPTKTGLNPVRVIRIIPHTGAAGSGRSPSLPGTNTHISLLIKTHELGLARSGTRRANHSEQYFQFLISIAQTGVSSDSGLAVGGCVYQGSEVDIKSTIADIRNGHGVALSQVNCVQSFEFDVLVKLGAD